ncbi:MAG: hypothetical protein PF508_18475 [Spirochaeta sp.]|nr:hypothetical protein [Spirochaeta sp.]
MKRYRIRSAEGTQAYLELMEESPAGYDVRIIRYYDGYQTTDTEHMTRELLETCVRTGYIEEMIPEESVVEAAS